MRELKFRAWDGETMHYDVVPSPLYPGIDNLYRLDVIREIKDYEPEYYNMVDILEGVEAVEQFTGLKDQEGNDVYEGDIVKYKLYADSRLDYVDKVFYSTTSGAFMVGDECNIRTLDCLINAEVIGNIHENPELLNEEDK